MMTSDQPVLVVDMATLRFHTGIGRAPVRLTTRDGQLLSVVHPRVGESRSDLAFRAMDAALREASILDIDPASPRDRRRLKVALYNPYSGDISFGGTPDTVSFTAAGTLALDPDGTVGVVRTSEAPLRLLVGDETLGVTDRTVSALTRVLAGHVAA